VQQAYSQSKLELYGLFRALTAWTLYLVGAPNLVVEMDAAYVKKMINNPDMHPIMYSIDGFKESSSMISY
jgi:hypothetical protein